jgi:hypothetical protein
MMDKSMEKIDVVKLLIYLMVFIVIVLSMILFMIIPNIKEYRASNKVYKQALVHKMRVQNILDERNKEFNKLKTDNRRAITAFVHKFSKDNFIEYTKKFFDEVELKEIEKKGYKKEFTQYSLKVSSSLKSPTNFYLFLKGLNRYENIVQADFPINMESNATKISSSFTIRVYEKH